MSEGRIDELARQIDTLDECLREAARARREAEMGPGSRPSTPSGARLGGSGMITSTVIPVIPPTPSASSAQELHSGPGSMRNEKRYLFIERRTDGSERRVSADRRHEVSTAMDLYQRLENERASVSCDRRRAGRRRTEPQPL